MRTLWICVAVAVIIAAGTPAAVGNPLGPVAGTLPAGSATAVSPRFALRAAIDAQLAAEQAAVAELSAQIAAATDASQALALVRALEQRKRLTALQLLVLQSEGAKAAGHEAAAARLLAPTGQDGPPAPVKPSGARSLRDAGLATGGRP